LPYRLPGAERYLERFKKAELDAEVELLRGVPDILEAAKLAQAAGKTVVFVSDMYLPAATISQFLEECGYPKGLPALFHQGQDALRLQVGSGLCYAAFTVQVCVFFTLVTTLGV